MRHVKLIIFNLNIYKEILDILLIDFSKIIITSISFNFPHGLLCKYEGFDWVYMFLVPLWAFSIFKQPLPLLITLIISPIYHPRHLNLMIIILIFICFILLITLILLPIQLLHLRLLTHTVTIIFIIEPSFILDKHKSTLFVIG